jgi:outer membrane immunogenic protein
VTISKFITAATMVIGATTGIEIAGVKFAAAADLSSPVYGKAPAKLAYYDWSGFYLGGHFGYLWGKSRVTENGVLTESGAPTNGAAGGLLSGYNWQSGPLLLGLEGDVGWSNAEGHGASPPANPPANPPPANPPANPPPANPPGQPANPPVTPANPPATPANPPATPANPPGSPANPPGSGAGAGAPPPLASLPNTYRLEWDSHFVGKAGFALDRWSIFATGGVAIAGFSFQQGVPPTDPAANSISKTYVGFSVGAGVEYAFTQNLLGRLQYTYDDFGSKDYTGVDGETYNVKLTSQTLRGGLSWKF